MEEPIGTRILRIAQRMGIDFKNLLIRSRFDSRRLQSILHQGSIPLEQEIGRLAIAIGVSPAELSGGQVEALLVKKGQEWRYPRLWRKILEKSGLRGNGNPQAEVTLAEVLLNEDMGEQLYNPDDPLPWWR
jgi:hypothetical protein